MLTSTVITRVDLPHEPGEWVEVRQLGYRQLELAAEARRTKVREAGFEEIRRLQAMAALEDLRPFFNRDKPAKEETPSAAVPEPVAETETPPPASEVPDMLLLYDMDALLRYGVTAWSYPVPVTPEAILDLDAETAELVARAIAPRARTEAELKNASSSSTPPSKEKPPSPAAG